MEGRSEGVVDDGSLGEMAGSGILVGGYGREVLGSVVV